MSTMKRKLIQVLRRKHKRHIVNSSRVLSAVMVPIYYEQGQYYILFTKRTEKVKVHKGQISFPGGVYQEGEGALVNTALRECAEEIGLMPDEVEVLGELDDVITTSNYIISPFVAIIPWPYNFKINQWEIEELIEIPISALVDKNCVRHETEIIEGKEISSYYYYYQETMIWGATAKILNQFLNIFIEVMGIEY